MGKITISILGGVLTVESIDPDVELTVIDYDNIQGLAEQVADLVGNYTSENQVYAWFCEFHNLADVESTPAPDLAAQYREYIGAPVQLKCQPA